MWTLFYKSIPSAISQSVIHYIKCHHHHTLSVKRVKKNTSTRGTFSANKTYCNTKHSNLLYQFCDLWQYLVLLSLH